MQLEDPPGVGALNDFQRAAYLAIKNILEPIPPEKLSRFRIQKSGTLIEIALTGQSPESLDVEIEIHGDGVELAIGGVPFDGCEGYLPVNGPGLLDMQAYVKERCAVLTDLFSGRIKVVESYVNGRTVRTTLYRLTGGSWKSEGGWLPSPFSAIFRKKTNVERFCKLC